MTIRLFSLLACLLITACTPRLQAGLAFVETPPCGYLTGHEQFHFAAQGVADLGGGWSLVSGWQHYSNGAGLGIGRTPNKGFDSLEINLEWVK